MATTRIRDHWSCENQQNDVLDVTFSEDSSRIRKGTGPEILSVFRRLALSLLRQDTTLKDSIRGKRCGWDNTALELLIAGFMRSSRAIDPVDGSDWASEKVSEAVVVTGLQIRGSGQHR